MIKAKVYTLRDPFDLIMEEQFINPLELKANEVIGKTIYSVVSPGTEIAAYKGAAPLRPSKVYPRVLGYCNMARIEFVGEKVSTLSVGDYILTFQSHRSYFKCPETDYILKFQAEDNLRYLTTTYLYHLGYTALLSGKAMPGYSIGIIGAGTLGYATYKIADICGFNTAVFTNQKNLIEKFRNDKIQTWSKDDRSVVLSLKSLNTDGFDIVINTSNSWSDWELALKIIRKGGSVINLGFPGRDEPIPPFNPLDSKYLYDKQITIKSTGHMPDLDISASEIRFTIKRNMEYLSGLINAGKLNPASIISSTAGSDKLEEEYKKMLKREGVFFTSLLEWE